MKIASKWLENSISTIRGLDSDIQRIETRILELLLEIEQRKAYAELRYDGLFSFCVKEFRWSESQAFQRIQAMRALQSVPEVKQMMDDGRMSVTTVAQVQIFLRQESTDAGIKRSPEEKLQIFESFQDKTAKEVKIEIAQRKGERILQKLMIELDDEGLDLWKSVRSQTAHQSRGSDLNCLKVLMKAFLEKNETPRPSSRRTSSGSIQPESTPDESSNPSRDPQTDPDSTSPYIPAALRRQVLARDGYQCRNCGSKYALQVDHLQPRVLGGKTILSNLRVLCRSCNLHAGVKVFGTQTMRRDALRSA